MLLPLENCRRLVSELGDALAGFHLYDIGPDMLLDCPTRVFGRLVPKNDNGSDRLPITRKLQLHAVKPLVSVKDVGRRERRSLLLLIGCNPGYDLKQLAVAMPRIAVFGDL